MRGLLILVSVLSASCLVLLAGLEDRPSNSSCIAPERTIGSPAELIWEEVRWSGFTLMQIRQAPDGSWYEAFRNGEVVRVAANGSRETVLTVPNMSQTGQLGLQGFALHPDYPNEPYFFFYYATNPSAPYLRIDRYTTTGQVDPPGTETFIGGSVKTVLNINKPTTATNHNGGYIEFSPVDAGAVLYLATGDGDERMSAQDPTSLFGKLLRIDVTDAGASTYAPEVVAMGFRNPFRWSFDSATGDVWIADVGETGAEEINFLPVANLSGPPLNFGWPYMEGFSCQENPGASVADDCGSPNPLTLPVHEYDHSVGISIVGGRVYRGSEIGGLSGRYFFADYFPRGGAGNWTLEPNPQENPGVLGDEYLRTGVTPPFDGMAGYAEGSDGELYMFAASGAVYKLTANGDQVASEDSVADALSETGCFDASGEPRAGLIPYEPLAPLWSDGATKRRWLAVPDGATVDVTDRGDFIYPVGTVLAKEFTVDSVRVETRLLMRHPDGSWAGYSYAWLGPAGNPLSDGQLLTGENDVTRPVPGTSQTWTYPSRGQCFQCHTNAADIALGTETLQLNSMMEYPSTGTTGHQAFTLSKIGVLAESEGIDFMEGLPEYFDTTQPLADRVWSYFHSNCANCHQPGASGFGGQSAMPDLRYDAEADRTGVHPLEAALCNVEATSDDLGLGSGALLVSPGNPGDWANLGAGGSVLYLRMAARPNVPGSFGQMPLLGSSLVDEDGGLALVGEWIEGLTCP